MTKNHRVKVTIEEKGVKRYVHIATDFFIIGRAPNVDVTVANDLISRQQLQVTVEDEDVWIEDLGSSNGTWVDQQRLPIREKFLLTTQVLALGSKLGPFIKIEPNVQAKILEIPSIPEEIEQYAAEEVIQVRRVANGSEISQTRVPSAPKVAAPKERLSLVNPVVKARVADKKVAVENNVIEQIKQLMNLESEEIHLMAVEEAKNLRLKADEEVARIIKKAKDEATQKLRETEQLINRKTAALQDIEAEASENLERLKENHSQLVSIVDDLKESELGFRKKLAQLQIDIEAEQNRIQQDRSLLQIEKNDLTEAKTKIENEYRELELEERKVKARIEVDTLEAKAKISQIYAAAEKAQNLKDALEPEVAALKLQKEQIASEIHDVNNERRRLEFDIEKLNKELGMATYNLEITRKDQELTKKEIEQSKQGLVQFENDLNKRDKDSQYLLERTQRETEEALYNSRNEAKRIIEEAKKASEELVNKAEDDLKKIIIKQDKLKAEFDRVKDEMSRRMTAAHDEATKTVLKGKEDSEKLLEKASKDAENIKNSATIFAESKQAEAMLTLETASKEASAKVENANQYFSEKKKESDQMIQQLKVEIVNRQKDSMNAYAAVEEKKKLIEEEIAGLDEVYQDRRAEVEAKAAELLVNARNEALELKTKLEASINEEMQKRRAESDALKIETQTQRQNLNLQLEAEAKESRQKQQATLTELRQVEMVSIKELRKKAEEEILKAKQDKAKEVSSNIYAMIASEMYKARNKVMDEEFVEPFAKNIKDMVADIMLDKASANGSKLHDLLKIKDNNKGKEKRFWTKTGTIAGSLVFMIMLITIFPSIITGPKNAIVSAFSEKEGPNNADAYVKMKVQEAKQRMTYNPETSVDYKATYVENYLFTTDFEAKRQDQAFQDKWILELNDYFIHNLDVKDTTIIKFVSLESSFFRDLAKLKNQVDPQNPEPKLEEMRARENEFREKLATIFADQSKVSRYYEYAEKFWNDYHKNKK
jgi:hypothetical protein